MKMWKKLSMLTMLLFLLTITGMINSQRAEASSYKGFEYSISGTKVTIEKYTGNKKNVVIPKKIKGKKVTYIGDYAFAYNYRIKKLVIPEGVKELGTWALLDMQKLRDITLPKSLQKIKKNCGLNFYTEASEFPTITIRVVKGSVAFRFVRKNYSSHNIIAK